MSQEQVEAFFTGGAEAFDAIYSGEKSRWGRFLDRFFRQDIYLRHRFAVTEAGDVKGRSVLDIGCGSGRQALDFASRGATVTGVDFSPPMIELAKRRAADAGLEDSCEFLAEDFLSAPIDGPFDVTLALGFFDYTSDALPFLKRAAALTSGKLIATFPKRWSYRAPIRKVRLALLRCPVFFYSQAQVMTLMEEAGFTVSNITRLPNSYAVVGEAVRRPTD